MSDEFPKKSKGTREAFAQFFESPSRPGLRKILQESLGEFNHTDFKAQWPENSLLARHILGFANSGGGVMVIGVAEDDGTLTPDGVTSLRDKTDINNGVKKFLPFGIVYEVYDFRFTESEYPSIVDKTFQVLLVEDRSEHIPFLAMADGADVRSNVAYVRDGVSSTQATHHQLQDIINRRIATGHSTTRELSLSEHLDELKSLYDRIPERIPNSFSSMNAFSTALSVKNPIYPEEGLSVFLARLRGVGLGK